MIEAMKVCLKYLGFRIMAFTFLFGAIIGIMIGMYIYYLIIKRSAKLGSEMK